MLVGYFSNSSKDLKRPIESWDELKVMPKRHGDLVVGLKMEINSITNNKLPFSSLMINIEFHTSLGFSQVQFEESSVLKFFFDKLVNRLICQVNMLIYGETRWLIS